MATVFEMRFGGAAANLPAATGGADTPILGLAAATTIKDFTFPFPVEIIGILASGAPAAGDTITFQPKVGGATNTALGVTLTNAAGQQAVAVGRGQGVKVAANTKIGVTYTTTTSGAYTTKDTACILLVAFGGPAGPSDV